MKVLGVTGGVATGKSTVTQMLAALGAPTLSADDLARGLLLPGTQATREVLAAFPQCAAGPDSVDRRALARAVFADANARLRLEALLHPPIVTALRQQAQEWHSQGTAAAGALEIPLLFEAHLTDIPDLVVVVMCGAETQMSRVMARLGGDEAQARQWIGAQWPLSEKAALADFLVHTDGTQDDTRRQVAELWEQVRC